MAQRIRHTKIVCTLGPASSDESMLRQLIHTGMNVARLNFSHGERSGHADRIKLLRKLAGEYGQPVAIMADLQGPKIRVGKIDGEWELRNGENISLLARGAGDGSQPDDESVGVQPGDGELPVCLSTLAEVVSPGSFIMLADGTIRLKVQEVVPNEQRVECVVEEGGRISSNKGVNFPDTELDIPSLTPKDISDLEFALDQEVDYVAQSFVRSPDDIQHLRSLINQHSSENKPQIIAKIEKRLAVERLDEILVVTDGVMVARGDLGVELGAAEVPLVQKRIIKWANDLGIPVITATQMLETMTYQPEPTRAEASDVANAILDGTTAVMLSGETAVGQYPLETVRVMDRIARAVEPALAVPQNYLGAHADVSISGALSDAACEIAELLEAAAIVVLTSTGSTARQVSKNRPRTPIVAASSSERTCNRLALDWGTVPVLIERGNDTDEYWQRSLDAACSSELVEEGDRVVFMAGTIVNMPGMTNMLRVEEFYAGARLSGA